MNYQNVTTTVHLRGKEVKVHALCTGTVAVKKNFRTKNGIGELAKINILLDSHYTEYMPIWVWVIEHPDGLMIVDFDIIFAGDISYNQEQVLEGELPGINANYNKSGKTYKNLLDYAAAHKTIYLPSHDGNAGSRLKNKSFLTGKAFG